MDPLTLFPYWFTIVLLVVNAIAVSRLRIEVEEEPEKDQHD